MSQINNLLILLNSYQAQRRNSINRQRNNIFRVKENQISHRDCVRFDMVIDDHECSQIDAGYNEYNHVVGSLHAVRNEDFLSKVLPRFLDHSDSHRKGQC